MPAGTALKPGALAKHKAVPVALCHRNPAIVLETSRARRYVTQSSPRWHSIIPKVERRVPPVTLLSQPAVGRACAKDDAKHSAALSMCSGPHATHPHAPPPHSTPASETISFPPIIPLVQNQQQPKNLPLGILQKLQLRNTAQQKIMPGRFIPRV